MSIPEHTPATEATPAVEQSAVKQAAVEVPETENTDASPHPEEATSTIVGGEPTAISGKEVTEETPKEGEAVVEATPASEGILAYKAPGLLKQFRYVKHYFWLSDEPLKAEHLAPYIRGEKVEVAHHNAAWAQETGKGVLFFTKRPEDKSTPSGMIMLSDVTDIAKAGTVEFSFKAGHHTHKFEAANSAERASWIVAIEKQAEEAKGLKETVTGSEGYKKTLGDYAKSPALVGPAAVAASKSTSRPPKKSLDAFRPTPVVAATPATNGVAKETDGTTEEEPKTATSKSRSQSRKRTSIFGSLLGKKEEKDEQKDLKKEEKAEEKAEKKHEKEIVKEQKHEHKKEVKTEEKAEKEHVKEEKKHEAQVKKEEAKQENDSSKGKEAAEAAAVAAVPAAAIAAEKKHEHKSEEKKAEENSGAVTPTDKKSKRGSVFGSLFGKKGVTSPSTEKSESEVAPAVPAKDSELPVSETAPKVDEPIENKPIDTAAVVAPVDTVSTPAAEEPMKEPTASAADSSATPKTEEKVGFMKKLESRFAGKKEHKEEKKEEQAGETIVKDPVVAAAPIDTQAASEPTATTSEERPAREKRRSSLFGTLGTMRRKTDTGSEETASPVEKREKSPLPQKLTGLFRKPSKAVKPTGETVPVTETTDSTKLESMTTGDSAVPSTTVPESTESKIVGDIIPDELAPGHFHDSVTTAPEETKIAA